jgi:Ribonuclease G/E
LVIEEETDIALLSSRAHSGSGLAQMRGPRNTEDFWTPATLSRRRPGAGVTACRILREFIMNVAVKIRGIYSTALTRFFLDRGMKVVSPSDTIIKRFGKTKGLVLVEAHDVEIMDSENMEGIRLQGESLSVDAVTKTLQAHFFDTIYRNKGEGSVEVEFPFSAKAALDELRNEVLPTVPRHHHFRIVASDYVNLLEEKTLSGHPEKRESVGRSMEKSLIWDTFHEGKEIKIEHVKLDGEVIFLSEGVILEKDFHRRRLVLKRSRFRGRTRYDGLGIEKREGDYAVSEVQEGLWDYNHTYYRNDGTLIGRYFNINTPVEFYPDRIRYVDLEIDVVQMPDGEVFVTDEEDLEEGFKSGYLSKELMERAKKAAFQRVETLRDE